MATTSNKRHSQAHSCRDCHKTCFKGLQKATHHLIRHARNLRRLKYGKSLICMLVKKPSVALKPIL
jgi:hypothetical protein